MKNRTIKTLTSLVLAIMMVATLVPAMFIGAFAATYTKVDSIAIGDTVVIAAESHGFELTGFSTTSTVYGLGTAYTTAPAGTYAWTVAAGTATGSYAFKNADGKYLYWTSGNSLTVTDSITENSSWTVEFDAAGNAVFSNVKDPNRKIVWNHSSTRFASYTSKVSGSADAGFTASSGYGLLQIWKLDTTPAGHDHAPAWDGNVGADGFHTVVCPNADGLCAEESKLVACEWDDGEETKAASCTAEGEMTYTCTVCAATMIDAIPMIAHDYVDGVCSVCQAVKPSVAGTTVKYTFSNYPSGTSGAENEEHVLDENVTVFTTKGYFTSEMRLYGSSSAYAVFASSAPVASIVINAGYKADTLNVYASTDGAEYELVEGVTTTTTYTDYTVTLPNNTTYIKLDVEGTLQIRVKYVEITFAAENTCTHANKTSVDAKPATCTENGHTAYEVCPDCGVEIGKTVLLATGHAWDGANCTNPNCGATRSIYTKVDVADLKDGDGIVIYHPTSGNLISGTANGNKLAGDAATVTDTIIASNSGEELFLVVRVDENGDYYFQTEDGLYLTTGATGNSLTLEAELTDYAKWYFDTTGTTATLRIVNRNATYNGGTQALEYYNTFTVYGMKDEAAFNLEIYKKEGYSNPTAPVNTQYSLSLKGDIGVNIYYSVSAEWLALNPGATITINGETKALAAGHNAYTFNISPADLDKKIEYYLSTDPTAITTVTAQGYIDYIVANSADFDANLVALVASLSAYGKAAYAFNNNTAFETVTYNEGVEAYVNGFANAEKVNGELVEWTGISAIIYSRNAIVVYYNDLGLAADATYSIEANGYEISGKLSDIKADGSIIISGIAAYDLDTVFTVTIGDDAIREVCLMNYIYAQKDSTGALQSLVVALANYSFAANTYFGK